MSQSVSATTIKLLLFLLWAAFVKHFKIIPIFIRIGMRNRRTIHSEKTTSPYFDNQKPSGVPYIDLTQLPDSLTDDRLIYPGQYTRLSRSPTTPNLADNEKFKKHLVPFNSVKKSDLKTPDCPPKPIPRRRADKRSSDSTRDDIIGGEAVSVPIGTVPMTKRTLTTSPSSLIEALLKHPRRNNIIFSPNEQCFRVNISDKGDGKRYTGLTKALRKAFWPNYSYEEARKGAVKNRTYEQRKRDRRKKNSMISWRERKIELSKGKRPHGIELGSVVHKQLEDFANMNEIEFANKYQEINAYTAKVIEALRQWRLRPVLGGAELQIYDENLRIATAIDMVCVDVTNGMPVLVEIKTGSEGHFNLPTNIMMSCPLDNFDSMPVNQARLQVLLARIIIRKRYRLGGIKAYVIHVCREGIRKFDIPTPWLRYENYIYEALFRTRYRKSSISRGKSPGFQTARYQQRPSPVTNRGAQKRKLSHPRVQSCKSVFRELPQASRPPPRRKTKKAHRVQNACIQYTLSL